jgi:hypothetical protein
MFKTTILIVACFLMAGCVESISYRHHRRRPPIHRQPVCQPKHPVVVHRAPVVVRRAPVVHRPMPRRAPVVIVKRVPNHDRYDRYRRPLPRHDRRRH